MNNINSLFDYGDFDIDLHKNLSFFDIILFIFITFPITAFLTLINEDKYSDKVLDWYKHKIKYYNEIAPFSTGNFAHAFAERWNWNYEKSEYSRYNLP